MTTAVLPRRAAAFLCGNKRCLVPYRKLADSTCFRREHRAYFEELAFIRFVRTGITLLFDLLQGFVSSAVQLELEDVDVVGSFDDAVHPSFALLFFGIDGIATHHPHEQIESIVEVAFAFTLCFLATHGVWDVCQGRKRGACGIVQGHPLRGHRPHPVSSC